MLNKTVILALFVAFITSCASTKNIAYLQDISQQEVIRQVEKNKPRIRVEDRLLIVISSSQPELAKPYNMLNLRDNLDGYSYYRSSLESFEVESDGCVNFPVLGRVEALGKTREELSRDLERRLEKVVPDVVATVSYANFKITILGEVSRPGTYDIQTDRVTLLEALGMAGDLSIYGKRDNVLVIREIEGEQHTQRIDLHSKAMFQSPYFYLQQNDVIYVEPNEAKAVTASTFRTNFPLIVSSGSFLITVATLLVTISK